MTEEKIGEGEFSSVHKGYLTTENGKRIPVAVKSLKSGVGMRYKSDFLGKQLIAIFIITGSFQTRDRC